MRINRKVNYENPDPWWWGYVVSGGIFSMWIFKKKLSYCHFNFEYRIIFAQKTRLSQFLETDGRRVAFPCTKEYTYVSVSEFTYTVVTWFINSTIVVAVEFLQRHSSVSGLGFVECFAEFRELGQEVVNGNTVRPREQDVQALHQRVAHLRLRLKSVLDPFIKLVLTQLWTLWNSKIQSKINK